MTDLILHSFYESFLLILVPTIMGILIGIPIALFLWTHSPYGIRPKPFVEKFIKSGINVLRSIPFIILIVLLTPLTRYIVGSSIGVWAAIVPLSLTAILLIAKVSEDTFKTIDRSLIEMGLAMGASVTQIIQRILLPESLPSLISNIVTIIINLIGFSAMAGAVGGGGLGDLAIRYGYQRYDFTLLGVIVVILILMVEGVQKGGDYLYKKMKK